MAETFAFQRRINRNAEGFGGAVTNLRTEAQTRTVRALADYPEYSARVTLLFDTSSSTTSLDAWRAFFFTHYGGTWFKFKAGRAAYRQVDGESVGTAAGGAGESFALDKKYIDATTLVVWVGGVDQTGDWSLTGNETAPLVETGAGFDAGDITVDYEFYIPCQIASMSPAGVLLNLGTDLATPGIDELQVTVVETGPGGHLV